MNIRTGDEVLHKPSGETWLVAGVEDGRLMWVGWPEGTVPVTDCELTSAAPDDLSIKLLHELAKIGANDMRCRYALRKLAEMGISA